MKNNISQGDLGNIFNDANKLNGRRANHYLTKNNDIWDIIKCLSEQWFRRLENKEGKYQQKLHSIYYDMSWWFMLINWVKIRLREYEDGGAAVECKISQREEIIDTWSFVKKERMVVAKPWDNKLVDLQWKPLNKEDVLRPMPKILTTEYERMSFVSPEMWGTPIKVTIDTWLKIKNEFTQQNTSLDTATIIEVKSDNWNSIIDKLLRSMWHDAENMFSKTNFWLAMTGNPDIDDVTRDFSNKVHTKFKNAA